MSLMGVDVGTTGCKVVVFDESGRILAKTFREYPLLSPRPSWYELDPGVVWNHVMDCIREANAAGEVLENPASALAISSQGEAVIPLDENGHVLANSPVSSDGRGEEQIRCLEDEMGSDRLYEITGQPVLPMYSLAKILWWRDQRPDVFKRAWKFLCYGDYVIWKLGLEPAIDYTMAARLLAFDIRSLCWSGEILSQVGLDENRLAATLPSGSEVGIIPEAMATMLGFHQKVVVVTGGHDQPCGALGAGVLNNDEGMYAIGTTECIALVLAGPLDGLKKDRFPCYPHVVPGHYISLVGSQTGGRLLRWYRDVLGSEEVLLAQGSNLDVYDIIISQVSYEPSKLMVLPHFAGSGSLFNDSASKGAILGLTFDTTRPEIVKAILEGITYEQALGVKYLCAAGAKLNSLRAIGGGARSKIWLHIKADILAVPILTMSVSEAASLGAALLAGKATGVYSSFSEAVAQTVTVERTITPDPRRSTAYQKRLNLYEKTYLSLREVNQLLSQSSN